MKKNKLGKFFVMLIVALMPCTDALAQDWNKILSGVASSLGEKVSEKVAEKTKIMNIEGAWVYNKPECKFQGDNLLAGAGGEVAANVVEKKITETLQKLGVKDHAVFTFKADGTYSISNGKRTTTGTYTLNKETQEIMMKSRLNINFTAKVVQNVLKPNKMCLLFNTDKLMALAQNITGTIAKTSTNKSMATIDALLKDFKGMQLGVELDKQGGALQGAALSDNSK